MNKQDLWNAWQAYAKRVNEMFMNGADPVQLRDALSCSCFAGDEPVEGVRTDDKGTMWRWLEELPGYHDDFKGIDDVKRVIGEGTGMFSEALINVQSKNFQDLYDDVFIWTQHAYDMYAEHWKW